MRWLAMLGLLAVLSACAPTKKPAVTASASEELPVTSVTMYASGATYLMHEGKVSGDATFNLRGKPAEIPAILKSLLVSDQGGSRPTVNLPSTKQSEPDAEKTGDEKADGEPKSEPKGKALAVHFKGKDERAVRVGYALESKPWKVTYRLLLDEAPSLQAWATITNDTEYEWKKVSLSLVSGRPLVLNADATADAAAASRAAKGAGATAGESLLRPRLIPSRQALDAPVDAVSPPAPADAAPPEPPPASGPLVNPREIFRYAVSGLSVPRRGAVAVPVLSGPVEIDRVSVYNERILARNPLLGASVRNTTPHYLLQGSMTVLDEGEYVGDASIENLAPGRKALVAWGIDLPVLVDSTHESLSTGVKSARLEKGVLRVTRVLQYVRRYTVDNEDQKDRTLVIEHPLRRGWTLVDPAGLIESTETLHRFRLNVPGGKRTSLIVREQTTEAEDIDLALADADSTLALSRERAIAAPVREALGKAAVQKGQLLERQRQIGAQQGELDRLLLEQAKMREAISAQPADGVGRKRLQEKLDKIETQVEELSRTIDKAQDELDKAAAELRDSLGKLDAAQ